MGSACIRKPCLANSRFFGPVGYMATKIHAPALPLYLQRPSEQAQMLNLTRRYSEILGCCQFISTSMPSTLLHTESACSFNSLCLHVTGSPDMSVGSKPHSVYNIAIRSVSCIIGSCKKSPPRASLPATKLTTVRQSLSSGMQHLSCGHCSCSPFRGIIVAASSTSVCESGSGFFLRVFLVCWVVVNLGSVGNLRWS